MHHVNVMSVFILNLQKHNLKKTRQINIQDFPHQLRKIRSAGIGGGSSITTKDHIHLSILTTPKARYAC